MSAALTPDAVARIKSLPGALRAQLVGRRQMIEQARLAKDARDKRPAEWFLEQEGRVKEMELAIRQAEQVAADPEGFVEWTRRARA